MAELFQEGFQTTLGGMSQAVHPSLLEANQYQKGVNIVSVKGLAETRPSWKRLQDLGITGFQGGIRYTRDDSDRFVFVSNGHVYIYKFSDSTLVDKGAYFNAGVTQCFFVQADRYLIIQDGYTPNDHASATWPYILDGDTQIDQTDFAHTEIVTGAVGVNFNLTYTPNVAANTTITKNGTPLAYGVDFTVAGNVVTLTVGAIAADVFDCGYSYAVSDENRVPKGSAMAYAHGMIHVVTPYTYDGVNFSNEQGHTGFVSGNIILGYRPQEVLLFEDAVNVDGGGRFVPPADIGRIWAMTVQHNVMNGVGQGPLILCAERGFAAYSVNLERTQWFGNAESDGDFGIILFHGENDVGMNSPFGLVHKNSEIVYRSIDGIRGMRRTVTEANSGGLDTSPMSREVEDILYQDDEATRNLVSMATWKNKIYTTTSWDTDSFGELLSLDSAPVGTIGGPSPSIYDGIFVGVRPVFVFNAIEGDNDYLFCVAVYDGDYFLMRFDETAVYDYITEQPLCRIYTREYMFQQPWERKNIEAVELWFSNVEGEVDVTCFFRPDQYPTWVAMSSGSFSIASTSLPQIRRRIRFTPATALHDIVTDDLLRSGYAFQFCIQWAGRARLEKARFIAGRNTADKYIVAEALDESLTEVLPPPGGGGGGGGNPSQEQTHILNDYDYEVPL